MKRFKQIFNHQPPARLIALGFASTILLGTLLLLMPFSIRSGITVQPVDALFSATSAVCVTGLLTVDTADTFTPVGQAVMAVLIQIGGLGITSIGMGLALAAGTAHQPAGAYPDPGSHECGQSGGHGAAGYAPSLS